jgi:hypothetical protein
MRIPLVKHVNAFSVGHILVEGDSGRDIVKRISVVVQDIPAATRVV